MTDVKVTCASAVSSAFHRVKDAGSGCVQALSLLVESTEGFKKTFQIGKGLIELTGAFTNVGTLSPAVNFTKGLSIVVSGTDIVGRVKEWTVPDKNGETMFHRHFAKIISRIFLALAHILDFVKMLQYFNILKLLRLSFIAEAMGKVPILSSLLKFFPDALKNPLIIFSAQWSILDSVANIDNKASLLRHIKHKESNWTNLKKRSREFQAQFFESRAKRYAARTEKYKNMSEEMREKAIKKLSRTMRRKVIKAQVNHSKYKKLSRVMQKEDLKTAQYNRIDAFMDAKASKWHTKIKLVKIDFAKAGVSIASEIAKVALVGTSTVLMFTGVGSVAALPIVLICLGLSSNGIGLFKFLFDKMLNGPSIPKVTVPNIRPAAAA